MVPISDNLGAFVNVSGSSLKRVAGINVKQAFFAPAIAILPYSGPLSLTIMDSI